MIEIVTCMVSVDSALDTCILTDPHVISEG